MRPIDANALKMALSQSFNDPELVIDNAPTLDLAPVVHGEWKNCGQLSKTTWLHRCSLCGCPQDYNHNYCPNCGAKMDGEK